MSRQKSYWGPLGKILSAIGTPPLLILKVCLLGLLNLGKQVSRLLKLFVGFIRTLYRNLQASILRFRLPRLPHFRPVFPTRQKILPGPQPKRSWPLFIWGFLFCLIVIFCPYWVKSQLDQLPNPKLLSNRDIPVSTKIYDRHGVLLYSFYAEENRSLITLDKLPKYVIDATLAIEDKNFYSHPGFDLWAITRAFVSNLTNQNLQGGSTLTQQLIKSALLTPERTIPRKIKEIILAFWAERIYSKEEILTMYLNQVNYGGTAYGIEAAAKTYFGKEAKDLSLAEGALLAGLPSAPSLYRPDGHFPDLTKGRQRQVLSAMVETGAITPAQAQAAVAEKLQFAPMETGIKAPHFVMYVKDYLTEKYGSRLVDKGGLEVKTSLDYSLQEKLTTILQTEVQKQASLNVGNAAALVTNPQTGETLAMIGSKDFFDLQNDGNVNLTTSLRSPGSAIKPLNYALAFEKGLITPATIIDDAPITYRTIGQAPYSPKNYDNKFHGKVPVRIALASSYNVPAVKVLEKNGLNNFLDFAAKMGITSFGDRSRFGLAITLGGGEIRMTDLAVAYGVFANSGLRTNLVPVISVSDYRGKVLEENLSSEISERVITPKTAFLINSILSDDNARAPAFGRNSPLNISGCTVAVKTGTAETKRDNWTIGYTPNRLVAVWVGNNNNSPMSPYLESGNTGAAAIWNPLMREILSGQPSLPFPQPDDIRAVTICAINGLLPCENCPALATEFFTPGTEPKTACKITKEEVSTP